MIEPEDRETGREADKTEVAMPGSSITRCEQTLWAGNFDLTRNLIRDILQNTTNLVEVLNKIGVAHKRANLLNEATNYYRHALPLSPARPSILKSIGQAYIHYQDHEDECYDQIKSEVKPPWAAHGLPALLRRPTDSPRLCRE